MLLQSRGTAPSCPAPSMQHISPSRIAAFAANPIHILHDRQLLHVRSKVSSMHILTSQRNTRPGLRLDVWDQAVEAFRGRKSGD